MHPFLHLCQISPYLNAVKYKAIMNRQAAGIYLPQIKTFYNYKSNPNVMKQVLYFIIALTVTAETGQAQDSLHHVMPNSAAKSLNDRVPLKYSANYYTMKSYKLRTSGWVLLSVGTVMGVTGLIVYEHNLHTEYDLNQFGDAIANSVGAEFLVVAGSSMVVVSIPLFITSAHYRKKALEMSAIMKFEPCRQPFQAGISMNQIPALGINFRF